MVRHTNEDALDEDELEELIDAAGDLRFPWDAEATLILVLGGELGMRAGEICHIREDWINWKRGLIEIPQHDPCTFGKDGGICGYCHGQAELAVDCNDDLSLEDALEERWNPKTSTSARSIPFDHSDRAEDVLIAFFSEFDAYPHSRISVNRRVNTVAEAAGFDRDRVYPHALRATAASTLAYAGLPPVALQGLFGWAQIETANKYIRTSGGATKSALHDLYSD